MWFVKQSKKTMTMTHQLFITKAVKPLWRPDLYIFYPEGYTTVGGLEEGKGLFF